MLNQSISFKVTSECFQVIQEFNRDLAQLFLEAHGGSFQNIWDQAQEHHINETGSTNTFAEGLTSDIQVDGDSMMAAARQGILGISVNDTTGDDGSAGRDYTEEEPLSTDRASERELDFSIPTVEETIDEVQHSDNEHDAGNG